MTLCVLEAPAQPSFLPADPGGADARLLCMVGFLDFVDARSSTSRCPRSGDHLRFSVQSLQWVVSGYFLTYGGLMLLGGRAADLLGRRRMLLAGTAMFAFSSFAAGLAGTEARAGRRPTGAGARRGDDDSPRPSRSSRPRFIRGPIAPEHWGHGARRPASPRAPA